MRYSVQTARIVSIGPGQGLKDMPKELQVKSVQEAGVFLEKPWHGGPPMITSILLGSTFILLSTSIGLASEISKFIAFASLW